MHPDFQQALATERAMDLHRRATQVRLAKAARLAEATRRGKAAWGRTARPVAEASGATAGTGRRQPRWRRLGSAVRRLPRRIATERNYVQRRPAAVRARHGYAPGPGSAPETYQEFLARTSGPLRHEPPAASRSNGHSAP